MKKGLRKVFRITGIVAGVIVVLLVAAVLVVLLDKPLVKKISQNYLKGKTGIALTIGKLDYTLFPLHVTASSVTVAYKTPMFTMDLVVDKLEVKGDIGKLLGGRMPAFESVEAAVAELRFDQTKISPEPIDFATLIPQLGEILAFAERTTLACRSMTLAVPGQRYALADLALGFARTAADRRFDLRLDTGETTAALEPGGPTVTTRLHASGALTLASSAAVDLRLALDAPRAETGGKVLELKNLSLETAGVWETKANVISLSKLNLDVPGFATASATLNADFSKNPSLEAGGLVRLPDLGSLSEIAAPFLPPAFKGVRIAGETTIQGKYTSPPPSAGKPASLDAAIDLPKIAVAFTEFPGPLDAELSGTVKVVGSLPDLAGSANVTVRTGRVARGDLTVGSSVLQVEARGTRASAEVNRMEASLQGLSVALPGVTKISLKEAVFSGAGRADLGGKSALISRLDCSMRGITSSLSGGKRLSLDNAALTTSGRADLAGRSATLTHFGGSLHGLSADLAGEKKVVLDEVKFDGSGALDMLHKSADVPGLEVRLPGLSPLQLSGRYDSAPRGAKAVRLESKGMSAAALRALLSPFLPASLSGWEMDGAVDVTLDAASLQPPAGAAFAALSPKAGFAAARRGPASSASFLPENWKFAASVSLAKAKFNDPSFTIASESLRTRLEVRGTYDFAASAVDWTAALDLPEGESLWKSFYVSWAKFPLRVDLGGRLLTGSRAVENLSAKFVLPGIGELHATGSAAAAPVPAFQLRAGARLSLEPLLSLFSQSGPAAGARPRISGEIAADLALVRDKGALAVDGRISLVNAAVENPVSKSSLAGISADLPVHLAVPVAGPRAASDPGAVAKAEAPKISAPDTSRASGSGGSAGPAAAEAPVPVQETPQAASPGEDRGSIKIGKITTPALTVEPPSLLIIGRTNAYRLEPFSLDLFGSRFEFGALDLAFDPAARTFHGTASLRPVELDLARLPFASPQLPLTGKAKLDFPALDITPSRIGVEGRADIAIFGGRIIVRDLAVVEPLAPGRAISCNIDLLDLDLKKVTDVIPFGEMTGIVRGEIRGLAITYGQPESFSLSLESVRRKGVAQTFSLKAVNNLTVISSGQQATAGTGGFWMRFIRGFRYAKLGIVSTLKNDTFTLNGTIHERGVEYLVKKPALFGINVINRMPDKKISFKEMMSRLQSIGGSEPPIVKSKIR